MAFEVDIIPTTRYYFIPPKKDIYIYIDIKQPRDYLVTQVVAAWGPVKMEFRDQVISDTLFVGQQKGTKIT